MEAIEGRSQQRPKQSANNKKRRSQQRLVIATKVFVTATEKELLLAQAADFNSISNYIRHRLGLNLNETGRRRKIAGSPACGFVVNDVFAVGNTAMKEAMDCVELESGTVKRAVRCCREASLLVNLWETPLRKGHKFCQECQKCGQAIALQELTTLALIAQAAPNRFSSAEFGRLISHLSGPTTRCCSRIIPEPNGKLP